MFKPEEIICLHINVTILLIPAVLYSLLTTVLHQLCDKHVLFGIYNFCFIFLAFTSRERVTFLKMVIHRHYFCFSISEKNVLGSWENYCFYSYIKWSVKTRTLHFSRKLPRHAHQPLLRQYSDLYVTSATERKAKPMGNALGFGKHFSDHMLTIDWDVNEGWSRPHIQPFAPIAYYPTIKVLHYAASVRQIRKHTSPLRLFSRHSVSKDSKLSVEWTDVSACFVLWITWPVFRVPLAGFVYQ